jgi:hypothetical protein
VPELFVGFFFVFLFLCEWANAAIHQSKKNVKKDREVIDKDAFSNFNSKKKYKERDDIDFN